MAEELGHPAVIEIGNFYTGELPDPLIYEFQDYLGAGIELAGGTVTFAVVLNEGTPYAGTGTTRVVPGDTTKVEYQWDAAEFATPGHWEGMFWVNVGSNTYASKKLVWYVQDGVSV